MLNLLKIRQLFSGNMENRLALGMVIAAGVLLSVTLLWQAYDSLVVTGVFDGDEALGSKVAVTAKSNLNGHYKKWPIFGKSDAPVKERVNTKYTLLGIILTDDKKKSKAIIVQPGEEAKVYMVGDSVNGLKVHKIEGDRVILRGYDAFESLYIAWESEDSVNKYQRKSSSRVKGKYTSSNKDYKKIHEKYREQTKKYRQGKGLMPGYLNYRGGFNQEKLKELQERYKSQGGGHYYPAGSNLKSGSR